jgi:hypothetical protein
VTREASLLTIKKESAWQFVTSSSGGVGVEFVAAEGGSLTFDDPNGATVSFPYGAAGLGLSAGFKLPKIGKLQVDGKSVGAAISPAAFPNAGKLYILDTFDGQELGRSDITGVCMFVEVAGGLVAGGYATAMLLGMDPGYLAAVAITPALINQIFLEKLLNSATALLLMGGASVGVQAGGGIAAFVGGLW